MCPILCYQAYDLLVSINMSLHEPKWLVPIMRSEYAYVNIVWWKGCVRYGPQPHCGCVDGGGLVLDIIVLSGLYPDKYN